MQVIILAAGMGNRLGELTQNKTKCMVEVNGRPLINRSLDVLAKLKIERIVLVVGYQAAGLKNYLGDTYNGVPIAYVENSIYEDTNNIYSLYLAKKYLEQDDSLLVESDLIFDEGIIKAALSFPEKDNVVVVDKYQSWMDGTVVELNKKNEITKFISKEDFDFSNKDNCYKTVNIYRFSKEFSKKHYVPFLEAYCKSVGHNEYYENVLKVLAFLSNQKLNAVILDGNAKWYEIDDKQDLHNAETLFSENVKSYQQRFGGYWRFPQLKDFCYLVNPYFPPKRMVREYQAYFENLLHDYPSTGHVQEILASKMFDCSRENIIVGNGAAELINCLMSSFGDKIIGVITPTFYEYIARIPKSRLKTFAVKNKDFSYSVDDLKKFSRNVDVLLLINPDNPSGNFIPKEDVLCFLDYLKNENKTLILDESFVDFSSENDKNSLINQDILDKFKNLVIVKSISKSYGVPGVRLGVMASSNVEKIKEVKSKLSIWNINSFGEFFLQIFGKYEKKYKNACVAISQERDNFFSELSKISFLRPIYSQANYFLCEVSEITATELTNIMMKKFNILLKDCTGKLAFDDKNYIRIAVRDRKDNNFLIQCLREVK